MATIRDELRPLDSLKPHSRNYNRHAEKAVGSLAAAMRVVAFTAPIICREDGTILGGHARRLALLKLRAESYPEPAGVSPGWQVPCRVVTCSQAEEFKILATDNPDPAQIDYDTGALAALLTDLQQHDSLAGTWYTDAGLDGLLLEITQTSQGVGGEGDGRRGISRGQEVKISPIFHVEDATIFEAALAKTGKANRAEALLDICRAYLEEPSGEERQQHFPAEDRAAA